MSLRFVTEHGPVEMVLFDGYHVGGRVLEEVMFECRFDETNRIAVNVRADREDYFSGLNTEQWLDSITRYVNRKNFRGGFDCDDFVCPKTASYVWVEAAVHEAR